MKAYITRKITRIRNAKNSEAECIDICTEILELYEYGKLSSNEALTSIKACLVNVTKIAILPTALRQVWRHKLQSIAAILSIAIIILLISLTSAIKTAAIDKQQNWINGNGADIFVTSPNNLDLISSSYFSERQVEDVKKTPGITSAQGTVYYFSNLLTKDKYLTIAVLGYEPTYDFGGVWKLTEGRNIQSNGEVVLDQSLKQDLSVSLGDTFDLANKSYSIVGFSGDTSDIGKKSVFMTNQDAQLGLIGMPIYNFILAKSDNPKGTVKYLNSQGIHAMTTKEFAQNNARYWSREVAPTVDMIIASIGGFGLLLLILMLSLSIRSRSRQVGVFMTIGTSLRRITIIELVAISINAVTGIMLGLVFSYIGLNVINQHSTGMDASLTSSVVSVSVAIPMLIVLISFIPIGILIHQIKPEIIKKEFHGLTLYSLKQ